MVSQKTTQNPQEPARYTYGEPLVITGVVRRTGRVRHGHLVQVTNETSGARYQVILKTDAPSTCTCPHWTKRLAGTNHTCKHIRGALAHLNARIIEEEQDAAWIARIEQSRVALWD